MTADGAMPVIAPPQDREPEPVTELPLRPVPVGREPAAEPGPEPRRFPVPGSGEPVPGRGGAVAGTVVPAVAAPADRISLGEHVLLSLRDWAARVAAAQRNHRSFTHWLWHEFWDVQPESLGQHRRYLRSRCWLKDYMTGWLRRFCEWENIAFALLIGRPLIAACNSISRIGARQSRFWIAAAAAGLAFTVWRAAHH